MNYSRSLAFAHTLYRCAPVDDPEDGSQGKRRPQQEPAIFDDLPYKVELWNQAKTSLEVIIAVTASGAIGFAAYHAATREFPDRHIILRRHDTVLARYNGPSH